MQDSNLVIKMECLGSNSVRGWWVVNGMPSLKGLDVVLDLEEAYDYSLAKEVVWLFDERGVESVTIIPCRIIPNWANKLSNPAV